MKTLQGSFPKLQAKSLQWMYVQIVRKRGKRLLDENSELLTRWVLAENQILGTQFGFCPRKAQIS